MASIVGKRRGAQTYYYLVESARVRGKPRIVSQQYLGSADEVIAKLSETPTGGPKRSRHRRFGAARTDVRPLNAVRRRTVPGHQPPRPLH